MVFINITNNITITLTCEWITQRFISDVYVCLHRQILLYQQQSNSGRSFWYYHSLAYFWKTAAQNTLTLLYSAWGGGGGGAFDARANFELLAISDNLR